MDDADLMCMQCRDDVDLMQIILPEIPKRFLNCVLSKQITNGQLKD